MAEEDDTGGYSQSQPNSNTILLRTKEDVSKELKEWMEIGSDSDGGKKLYDNAIQHIESILDRPLSYWGKSLTERQYVITLLELWLKKSLEKAFEYFNDEKNDVSQLSIVLSQLNFIHSFEDIRSIQVKDAESPLFNCWCDRDCEYLQLILEQEDLFKKTPRFTAFVGCHFKQFKTSCIEKLFSRCLNEIVTDTKNGKFIVDLNDFLVFFNEEKNLLEMMQKNNNYFRKNYVEDDRKTGHDVVNQLVKMFVTRSTEDFLAYVEKEEKLKSIWDNLKKKMIDVTENEWQETFHSLVENISQSFRQTDSSQTSTGNNSIPEWFTRFQKASSLLKEVEWTDKLNVFTKETCKKFLLPDTKIEFKVENGKEIIFIEGVVIFVSQMIAEMKVEQTGVQEMKIVGLNSVHIDCDLDNGTWHGINISITTDKLIVDDKICWDVSGKSSTTNSPIRGKPGEPGESGGNVHVVCNQIINGQKWTIVSDGGDGSDSYKWTKEEFEKSFPSMSTEEANIKTVLTTLQEILPEEHRKRGKYILPGQHEGNFLIEGIADDGSQITVIFYGGKKGKQTLILIKGGRVGQGGYGGDITVECFTPTEVNQTHGIPFTGTDTRRNQLGAVRLGVYEASGSNGMIGKVTGDVAFIQKSKAKNGSGILYGFEKVEKIAIKMWLESKPTVETNLYVKHENKNYAKLELSSYSASDSPSVSLVDSVKKKSVIRQSLIQRFDQIDERNQLMESIQKMLSNPTEHHSSSIDEIIKKMDNKVHEFHQLTTQRQQNQLEQIQKEQYVKPAIDSSVSIPKSKLIGRRPVWNDNKDVHQLKDNSQKNTNVYCLDELFTEDGSDSALHCLFGQINSEGKYVCNDTNKFRKSIAQYIREEQGSEKEEHAKFIESPTGKLESDELEILSKILSFKIHVYDDHFGSSCFRYLKTLPITQSPSPYLSSHSRHYQTVDPKEIKDDEYCVLYEGDGRWRRLQPNYNLHLFCSEFTPKDDEPNSNDSTYFNQLRSWINGNQEITNRDAVNSCIDKFNPTNKTPDKLCRLVFDRLNNANMDDDNQKKLVQAICSLAEWVEYYNTWNRSPFFYLTIVKKYEPQDWVREFLLLEMETRLEKPLLNLDYLNPWREEIRKKLNENQTLLSLLTKIAMDKEANDILLSLNFNKLLRMLTVCKEENCDLKQGEIHHSVINLFYKHRSKFWEEKVNEWLINEDKLKDEKRKEYVNLLLEMEHRSEIKLPLTRNFELLQNTLQGHNFESEPKDVDSIIDKIIKLNPKMNENVKESVKKVFDHESPAIDFSHQEIETAIETWINDGLNLIDAPSLKKFLDVFDYAVKQKMGFKLRDTQKVTLIILLFNKLISKKELVQVSTGEGKSIIVAGVAIGFALSQQIIKREKNNKKTDKRKKNKIDVITSNDVLALRDSSLSVAEGGLKEIYEFFNVTVSNNCNQSVDERKKAYNMDVVYGTLANFQRDYLLDKFYNRNIRGDRRMEFVIIDEADCMLLDRGSNVLYLSHDIPGMETLESLYLFIWAKIQTVKTDEDLALIKSAILYDLYGQIKREDLKNIQNNLLGQEELESERTALWDHLINEKVIDPKGRLLIHGVNEIPEKINYSINSGLDSKLKFYFRKIAERDCHIRIPSHLLDFVDRHLDTWLDNARRALELKQDEDYVIDCDRSDTSPDLNPQVIIIDPETGTDQFNSQWDGALHQFLQLKEGCKLTLQSLKAVFISNANYMNKYDCLVGVSGTLGSEPEQEFLKNKYDCNFFTIPTAVPKQFSLKPPKLLKTKESWRNAIIEETRQTVEKRSIVIFCQSIKEVNEMYKHLKSSIPVLRDKKRIHRYTRDYEKFEFESKTLDEGHVIVATNLAGRGTDIKLSPILIENGGLHICLTYFPENERVEEQAMGRAARKGEPGSGILILCEEPRTAEECGAEKIFVIKEERAWKERQRISRLKRDFNNIEMLEKLFESANLISKHSINTTFKLIEEQDKNEIVQIVEQLNDDELLTVIHDNLLDKWAMWLDKTDFNFKSYNINQDRIGIDFKQLTRQLIIDIPECMTPARKVTFSKHLAMEKSNKTGKKIDPKDTAIDILKPVISSPDNFFYPAAFYYHAFILLTKGDLGKYEFKKEKEKFIRMLRSAESILNEHIDMQIFFIQIHQSERKLESSFYTVDGYKEQKQNNIKILEYFLRSIQWLLGSCCSISDLREAGSEPPKVPGTFEKYVTNPMKNIFSNKKIKQGSKEHKIPLEKMDAYFLQMIKNNCIGCVLNDPDTIPSKNIEIDKSTISSDEQNLQNASKIILQIAKDYGIRKLLSLEDELKSIFDQALNEEQIEKELKKTKLIPCTRKAFWNKLINKKALNPLTDWKEMECFIMSDSEELLKELNLDKEKAITLEFGSKSFDETTNRLYVLYNPTHNSQQHLRAENQIMFSKEYVQEKLVSTDKYREKKKHFESNKIAQLDLDKLNKVDLKSFGRLCKADLDDIHITNKTDQDEIWNHLIKQGIIDDRGYFVSDYDLTNDFSYPDCLVYAEAVMQLVGKIFVFELVRQQWLKTKDNPDCLRTIHLLPRKPYRDMLADLMEAHVISGARVTENFAIDFKGEINKITEYDQERDCLMEYLTTRQSILTAKPITPEFFLDFIERDIHFASELYIFRLVGFDRVIDIKDRKWTAKRKLLASLFAPLIVTGGLASIGVGGFLTYRSILSFGFSKNLFFMGGFSDILYAVETILSRKKFTWADYGRQRIRSAIGKMEPIDAIKAIWKLSGSSNQSFRDATVSNEHPWNKRTDQNQVNTKE